MLELGVGAEIFRGIGLLLWVVLIVGLGAALTLPKSTEGKAISIFVVLAIFFGPMLPGMYERMQHKQRYETAKALFDERCKTAGEKIYRTVENVEGIQLLNLRNGKFSAESANPNWPEAALPNEATGMGYIEYFLIWEHKNGQNPRGFLNDNPNKATARGYQFVDVKQSDGSFLRYRLKQPGSSELISEIVKGQPARYALGTVNHVDPADRAHWVAGVTLKITDTKTGEVIAERVSYAFEPGLGNTLGERSPWGFAVTCPSFKGWDGARTRFFADQILKPIQGE